MGDIGIKELKVKAKELGIKGFSSLSKEELLDEVEKIKKTDEVQPEKTVRFKKLIKGAFYFNGHLVNGFRFELTKEESEDKRILNAIKNGVIAKDA